jgi:hypothetical protein
MAKQVIRYDFTYSDVVESGLIGTSLKFEITKASDIWWNKSHVTISLFQALSDQV